MATLNRRERQAARDILNAIEADEQAVLEGEIPTKVLVSSTAFRLLTLRTLLGIEVEGEVSE
jgi:hypothetical protein